MFGRNWWKKDDCCPSLAPRPLPADYYLICSDYVKKDVEEVIQDVKIPEIVQATFYTIAVNDAIELCVLPRNVAKALRDALKDLSCVLVQGLAYHSSEVAIVCSSASRCGNHCC